MPSPEDARAATRSLGSFTTSLPLEWKTKSLRANFSPFEPKPWARAISGGSTRGSFESVSARRANASSVSSGCLVGFAAMVASELQ
jgi:hypothetical protein